MRDIPASLRKLAQFADILMPRDAEEPILAPSVRAAVFEWLAEVRAEAELKAVGCMPRRTALLYGPPGCGKTTLAHHFAARLGMPLACVRSESLVSKYLGETGVNIGSLFQAMGDTEQQVVIFFDEVDAIGARRMNDQGASVERSDSLNVLLRRIEMFEGVALAATNRPDVIDPALWRRFGMQISVDLPTADERFAILRRYIAPFEMDDDAIDAFVDATDGASPALLRALMEGIKRSVIIGPKVGRDIGSAAAVISAVIAGCAPPPEYEPPPLWVSRQAIDAAAAALEWPLRRAGS